MTQLLSNINLDKKRIIILGVLAVLIISLILVLCFRKKVDENLEILFDPDNPILIEDSTFYGYTNSVGDKIIDTKYKFATPFYKDYALVSDNEETKEYIFLDKKGKEKLTLSSNDTPKYFAEYGVWLVDNTLYDKDLKIIFEGNCKLDYIGAGYFSFMEDDEESSGIIDSKGKTTFKWDEDYINVSLSQTGSYMDTYALVTNMEEKESIVNLKNGKVIYELSDPDNTYIREEKNNIFRVINRSENYKTIEWLYIEDDKIAYSNKDGIYDISLFDYKDNILKLDYGKNYQKENHHKQIEYYDFKEDTILDEEPIELDDNQAFMKNKYGYTLTKENGSIGLMKDDEVLLEPDYESIEFLPENLYEYIYATKDKKIVILKKDGDYQIYNLKRNDIVATIEGDSLTLAEDSSFIVFTIFKDDGFTKDSYIIYNLITNKTMNLEAPYDIELYRNYIIASKGNKREYYSTEFKQIY